MHNYNFKFVFPIVYNNAQLKAFFSTCNFTACYVRDIATLWLLLYCKLIYIGS